MCARNGSATVRPGLCLAVYACFAGGSSTSRSIASKKARVQTKSRRSPQKARGPALHFLPRRRCARRRILVTDQQLKFAAGPFKPYAAGCIGLDGGVAGWAAVWLGDLLYRDHFAVAAGAAGGGGGAVAGNWMPSPYFATSGMVMGRCPRMGISPNSAFTNATSAGGTVLYVAR